MINLTNYIRESIFDIDDNIENMDKRTIEDLLFKPKSTINAFRYIYDVVKNKEIKHEHSLKYNGPYYVSFFEEIHDCTMIIIAPYDSHNWQMVAITAKKLYNKIELMDYREETPTRYAFHFTAKGRVYFELPKEYNFLFDSIASRCKYKTGNIIKESIFDDEDTHMDNLDKVADIAYIKKLLKKDDWDDFEKATDEFEKIIKKDYKKIPSSKVDFENKYLIFVKGEYTGNKYNFVYIYYPNGPKKFQSCMIAAFTGDNQTQEICFRRYYDETKSGITGKNYGQTYKSIYELPKEYEWMIEWMNKEYEDGRYNRIY